MLKLKYYSVAILSILLLSNTAAFAAKPVGVGGGGGGLIATKADLDTEIANRIAGDDAEVTARTAGDSTLQTNISAEVTARTAADNTLQTNIGAEVSARTAAENTLQTNINNISLTPGPQGVKGDTGLQGIAGSNGTNGAVGATGPQGPAGVAAVDRTADMCALYNQLYETSLLGNLTVPDYCVAPEIIYNIGDNGPAGGIVFYITDGGLHGLEAAPVGQPTAPWGCHGTNISGAKGTAVGTGAQNTAAIVAGCAESGIAAKIADAYSLGGFKDWFLPSKDELNMLYVATAQPDNGIGTYWTSTQVVEGGKKPENWAYFVTYYFSIWVDNTLKTTLYGVLPIRSF